MVPKTSKSDNPSPLGWMLLGLLETMDNHAIVLKEQVANFHVHVP